jgi:hypothetical protein
VIKIKRYVAKLGKRVAKYGRLLAKLEICAYVREIGAA